MNVVVEWLTLLIHIPEISGSNLGRDIGYPDWGRLWFASVPPGKFQDNIFS
jgi:hypothetical protein